MGFAEWGSTVCLAVVLFAFFMRFQAQTMSPATDGAFDRTRRAFQTWSAVILAADLVSVPLLVFIALQPAPSRWRDFTLFTFVVVGAFVVGEKVRSSRFRARHTATAPAAEMSEPPSTTPSLVFAFTWLALLSPLVMIDLNRGQQLALVAFASTVAWRALIWSYYVQAFKRPSELDKEPDVAALAEHVGVNVAWLGHMPGATFNAFALHGNRILLVGPRSMLEPDESLAIIAHELTHLKNRDTLLYLRMHYWRMAFGLAVPCGLLVAAGENAGVGTVLLAITGARLANAIVSWVYAKRLKPMEYVADRGATENTSPEVFAAALVKIHLANGIPDVWPRWTQPFISHPPLKERLAMIRTTRPSEGRS